MHSAYVGVQSKNAAARANALEFLDNILKPQVRSLILPLLDPQVTAPSACSSPTAYSAPRSTARAGGRGAACERRPVAALLRRLRGGHAAPRRLEPELDKLAQGDNPLLRETVRAAKQRLAGVDPDAPAEAPHADQREQAWRPAQEGMGVGEAGRWPTPAWSYTRVRGSSCWPSSSSTIWRSAATTCGSNCRPAWLSISRSASSIGHGSL